MRKPRYKPFLLLMLPFLLLARASVGWAAPLAQARTTGLRVSLESSTTNTFKLKIDSLSGSEKLGHRINVLVIENPTRLVVDVAGVSSKAAQTVPVRNSKISALRIGVHPDKTRIVLDVGGDDAPEYEISEEGEIMFSFGGSAQKDENEDDLPRPLATPKKSVEIKELPNLAPKKVQPEATPEPTPRIIEDKPNPDDSDELPAILKKKPPKEDDLLDDLDRSSESSSGAKSSSAESSDDGSLDEEIPAITNQPGTGMVKAIYYQTLSDTGAPAVTLDIDGLDSYSLNKRKPDLYELVIQNAHLSGKHLSLPQFPPDTFKGFSVIVAREEGGNVFLKIYVEENVKLFPFVAKGQLWLKVSQ